MVCPCQSGTIGAKGTAYKIGSHKYGVGSVGGLRHLLNAAALIAKLQTLQAYVYQDDGYNKSHESIAKQTGRSPRHKLQARAINTHLSDAPAIHEFAHTACRYGPGYAAQS
jgi:hypothetical protein